MAPEHPPMIVILDTRLEETGLRANLQYVESADYEKALRVRWSVNNQPKDFRPIGNGVAFVYEKTGDIIEVAGSDDVEPSSLGDNRYRWTEGMHFATLMLILILPHNHTIIDPRPQPIGAKIFDARLAVYWTPKRGESDRATIDWSISELKIPIEQDLIRVNREYILGEASEIERETIQVRLRRALVEHFNTEELRTLCHNLGVDYEIFPQGRDGFSRELVEYFQRRSRLERLIQEVRRQRSTINFD
jgi:hypothetical protein